MIAEKCLLKCTIMILLVKSKKTVFYKTVLSRGRNSNLRLRGAGVGSEKNNFGSTTLVEGESFLGFQKISIAAASKCVTVYNNGSVGITILG